MAVPGSLPEEKKELLIQKRTELQDIVDPSDIFLAELQKNGVITATSIQNIKVRNTLKYINPANLHLVK